MADLDVGAFEMEGAEQVFTDSDKTLTRNKEVGDKLMIDPRYYVGEDGILHGHRNVPLMGSWIGLPKEPKRSKRKALTISRKGDSIGPLQDVLLCSEHRIDADVSERSFAARLAVELKRYDETKLRVDGFLDPKRKLGEWDGLSKKELSCAAYEDMLSVRRNAIADFEKCDERDNERKMVDIIAEKFDVLREGCNDTSMAYVTSILALEQYSLSDEPTISVADLKRAQEDEVELQAALRKLGVETIDDVEKEKLDGTSCPHIPEVSRFIDHVTINTTGKTYNGVDIPMHFTALTDRGCTVLKTLPRRGPQTAETQARLWVAHLLRQYVIPNLCKVSAVTSTMHAACYILVRTSSQKVIDRATELMQGVVSRLGGFQDDWPTAFHTESWNDWGLKTDCEREKAALWQFGFGMHTEYSEEISLKVELFKSVWAEIDALEQVECPTIKTESDARYNRDNGWYSENSWGPGKTMLDVFEDCLSWQFTCPATRQDLANVIDDSTDKLNVRPDDVFKQWRPVFEHGIEKVVTGLAYAGRTSECLRLRCLWDMFHNAFDLRADEKNAGSLFAYAENVTKAAYKQMLEEIPLKERKAEPSRRDEQDDNESDQNATCSETPYYDVYAGTFLALRSGVIGPHRDNRFRHLIKAIDIPNVLRNLDWFRELPMRNEVSIRLQKLMGAESLSPPTSASDNVFVFAYDAREQDSKDKHLYALQTKKRKGMAGLVIPCSTREERNAMVPGSCKRVDAQEALIMIEDALKEGMEIGEASLSDMLRLKAEDDLVKLGLDPNPLIEVDVGDVCRKMFLWEMVPPAEKKDEDLSDSEMRARLQARRSVARSAFTKEERESRKEKLLDVAREYQSDKENEAKRATLVGPDIVTHVKTRAQKAVEEHPELIVKVTREALLEGRNTKWDEDELIDLADAMDVGESWSEIVNIDSESSDEGDTDDESNEEMKRNARVVDSSYVIDLTSEGRTPVDTLKEIEKKENSKTVERLTKTWERVTSGGQRSRKGKKN